MRNPCTCHYHAYWRFDWAIDGLDDHHVQEHNGSSTLREPVAATRPPPWITFRVATCFRARSTVSHAVPFLKQLEARP